MMKAIYKLSTKSTILHYFRPCHDHYRYFFLDGWRQVLLVDLVTFLQIFYLPRFS